MSLLTHQKADKLETKSIKIEKYFKKHKTLKGFCKLHDTANIALMFYKQFLYRTPHGYADWIAISVLYAEFITIFVLLHNATTQGVVSESDQTLRSSRIATNLFRDWVDKGNESCVYCIKSYLVNAFLHTDIISKTELLQGIDISIPPCIVLFESGQHEIKKDVFLECVVLSTKLNHKGKLILTMFYSNFNICVGVIDNKIFSKESLDLECKDKSGIQAKHKEEKLIICNLVFQIALCIAGHGDFISNVSTEDLSNLPSEGFGKLHNKKHQPRNTPPVRYPRWIGKDYKPKRESIPLGGSHSSPRTHWRRGHLRMQPYGEGRQEKKPVWIEPVLVNAIN